MIDFYWMKNNDWIMDWCFCNEILEIKLLQMTMNAGRMMDELWMMSKCKHSDIIYSIQYINNWYLFPWYNEIYLNNEEGAKRNKVALVSYTYSLVTSTNFYFKVYFLNCVLRIRTEKKLVNPLLFTAVLLTFTVALPWSKSWLSKSTLKNNL